MLIALSACAAPRDAPVPTFTGQDSVTTVNNSAFIGSWDMTILNPRATQEISMNTVTYSEDGQFTSILIPPEDSASPFGSTPLNLSGDWSIAEGVLVHSNVQASSDTEDAYALELVELLNNSPRELGGSANVYEVSASHFVLVGDDGIATRYDRR